MLLLAGCTSTYFGRVLLWNVSSIDDHGLFPSRDVVNNPAEVVRFVPTDGRPPATLGSPAFRELLERTGTTAFIVLSGGRLLFEWYGNGHRRDSLQRAFSVSKSVTSLLVGIAIDEGNILGTGDLLVRHVPELRGRGYDTVTVGDLLRMSTGIRFTSGPFPWTDETRAYYDPNLRQRLRSKLVPVDAPGRRFRYSSYDTLLLGLVLERATGMRVSDYLQAKLWKRLGMEFPATMSLDSERSGLESTPSGLNARAVDLAKIGMLVLEGGCARGERVVSQEWIGLSTQAFAPPQPGYYPDRAAGIDFAGDATRYACHWWCRRRPDGGFDIYASGHLGQLVYIAPREGIVVARFGRRSGVRDGWPSMAQRLVWMLADAMDWQGAPSGAASSPSHRSEAEERTPCASR